jgi:hypothetical protein
MVSAWIGPLLAGLTGLGGLFGKQKQESTTTGSSTPNYDPQQLAFRNFLMDQFKGSVTGLPTQDQYTTAGLKNLGDTSAMAGSRLEDILASRGLGRTTAGASSAFDNTSRNAKNFSDFLTSSPFNYANYRQPFLQAAGGFSSSLPVGSNTTQRTIGTGGPSSPAAGFFGGATQGLAGYLGQENATNNFMKALKSAGLGTPSGGGGGGGYDGAV